MYACLCAKVYEVCLYMLGLCMLFVCSMCVYMNVTYVCMYLQMCVCLNKWSNTSATVDVLNTRSPIVTAFAKKLHSIF